MSSGAASAASARGCCRSPAPSTPRTWPAPSSGSRRCSSATSLAAPRDPRLLQHDRRRARTAPGARSPRCSSEHLVEPVEFVSEIEAMYGDGARLFVEVGPRSVLSGLVGQILGDREHVAVAAGPLGPLRACCRCSHCLAALAAEGVAVQRRAAVPWPPRALRRRAGDGRDAASRRAPPGWSTAAGPGPPDAAPQPAPPIPATDSRGADTRDQRRARTAQGRCTHRRPGAPARRSAARSATGRDRGLAPPPTRRRGLRGAARRRTGSPR